MSTNNTCQNLPVIDALDTVLGMVFVTALKIRDIFDICMSRVLHVGGNVHSVGVIMGHDHAS